MKEAGVCCSLRELCPRIWLGVRILKFLKQEWERVTLLHVWTRWKVSKELRGKECINVKLLKERKKNIKRSYFTPMVPNPQATN